MRLNPHQLWRCPLLYHRINSIFQLPLILLQLPWRPASNIPCHPLTVKNNTCNAVVQTFWSLNCHCEPATKWMSYHCLERAIPGHLPTCFGGLVDNIVFTSLGLSSDISLESRLMMSSIYAVLAWWQMRCCTLGRWRWLDVLSSLLIQQFSQCPSSVTLPGMGFV